MLLRRLITLLLLATSIFGLACGWTLARLLPPGVTPRATATTHCEIVFADDTRPVTLFDRQITMGRLTSSTPGITKATVTVGPGKKPLEITALWLSNNTIDPIDSGLLRAEVRNVEVRATNYAGWRIDAATVCGWTP